MKVVRHSRACFVVFLCCLLLGGGTRPGFLSDAALQLISVPLLVWSLSMALRSPTSQVRRGLLCCALLVAVPLVQLIPLPPEVWLRVPGRAQEAATFAALGLPTPWRPISVHPDGTILSALSLIPPVAVFISVLVLDDVAKRRLSLALVAVGGFSVFLGLTQIAQGPTSALRLFEITNPQDAVGLFANRNHYAALLYCSLVFAIGWTMHFAAPDMRGSHTRATRTALLVAGLTLVVVLVAGAAMARSRAGVALTTLALTGGFLLALRGRQGSARTTPVRLLGGAVALGLAMVLQLALYRVLERFADDPLQDARGVFTRITLAAAETYWPFGSGIGTFTRVYPLFETPKQALLDTYVNRAHNDAAEFLLEAGALALVVIAVFVSKLAVSIWTLWFRRNGDDAGMDVVLMRAATLVLALLCLHAFVDYPLRTNAMAAVFALSFGLLFATRTSVLQSSTHDTHARTEPKMGSAPAPGDIAREPAPPRKPWGESVEWPDAWKRK